MGNEQSSTSFRDNSNEGIIYSNLRNNHDDRKVRHSSRTGANRAKESMIRRGKPGAESLVTYYNTETKGWYNGKPKGSSKNNASDSENGGGIALIGLALFGVYLLGSWAYNKAVGTEK